SVDVDEIIPTEVQRNRAAMPPNPLAEPGGLPGEPAHVLPRRQVQPLDERGRDIRGVGVAADDALLDPGLSRLSAVLGHDLGPVVLQWVVMAAATPPSRRERLFICFPRLLRIDDDPRG